MSMAPVSNAVLGDWNM